MTIDDTTPSSGNGDTLPDQTDVLQKAESLASAMFNRKAMTATLSPVAARRLALFPSDLPGMVTVVIGSAGHGIVADDDGNPSPLVDAGVAGSFLVPTEALFGWGFDLISMSRPDVAQKLAKLTATDDTL